MSKTEQIVKINLKFSMLALVALLASTSFLHAQTWEFNTTDNTEGWSASAATNTTTIQATSINGVDGLQSLDNVTMGTDSMNVIFILIDDMGWKDLGCYGSDFFESPEIDDFAETATLFTNAYAASPLCSPTRASILSGLTPGRLGFFAAAGATENEVLQASEKTSAQAWYRTAMPQTITRLSNDYVTFAEVFKALDYSTAFMGKWHLGREPYFPENQGFDLVVGGREHSGPPGPGKYFAPWDVSTLPVVPEGTHICDVLTDTAISYITEKKDDPFMLCLWYYDVHGPWMSKEDLKRKYEDKLNDDHIQRSPTMGGMIENMDANIGRLMAAIDSLNLDENTIVVLTSDNGGNMYSGIDGEIPTNNYPLRGCKGNNHEGGVRVPLIVRVPGVTNPNTQSDVVTSTIDHYPTLLELLDITMSEEIPLDGESFVKALNGEDYDRAPTYSAFFNNSPATGNIGNMWVRDGDWKLYKFYYESNEGDHQYELFNLKDDLSERNNLADLMPEKVAELSALIEARIIEADIKEPQPNTKFAGNSADVWLGSNNTEISIVDNAIHISSSGVAPSIETGFVPKVSAGTYSVNFKIRSTATGGGKMSWTTSVSTSYNEQNSVSFDVVHDGQWHTYSLPIPLDAAMKKIRIQPADSEGVIDLRDLGMTTLKGHYIREWPLTYSSVQLKISSEDNVNIIEGAGETLQLFAKNASGEDVSVDWSVDYDSLATIDANGLLTTVSGGIVTIKAEAKDGSGTIAIFDLKVIEPNTLNLIGFEHTNARQSGGVPVDFEASHTSENREKWATSRSEMSYLMIRRNAFDDWLETNMSDFTETYGSLPIMIDETAATRDNDDLANTTYTAHHAFYSMLSNSTVNLKYVKFQSVLSKWNKEGDPIQGRIDNIVHFLDNCLADYYPPSSGIEIGIGCARPTQNKSYKQQYLDLQKQIEERTGYALSFILIDWPAQSLREPHKSWNAGSTWSDTRWAQLATCKSYIEDTVGVKFSWSIVDTDTPTADQYKQRVKAVTQEYIKRIGMPTPLSACMAWSALPDRVLDSDLSDNPAGNGQLCAFREIIDIMNGTVITYDLTVNSGTGGGSYPEGNKVSITADAPASGNVFDQWTGDVTNVANVNDDTTTITMPAANATVSATYVPTHNDGNILINPGFETPVVSSYKSAPFTEGWTFSNVSGVQRNGSPWGAADAPGGVQTCFLQWGGASISQTFDVSTSGDYLLKCQMARGDTKVQPVDVYLDDTLVNTFSPESSSFAEVGGTYYLVAGVHTIEFTSSASKSLTTFIDDVYFGMQEPVKTYILTVNSGTGTGSYTEGTEVIITADAPASAYVFDQWTGDVAYVVNVNDDTTTITMPAANATLTATYVDSSITAVESNKMQDDMGLKIYPNPAKKILFIEIPENSDRYREGEMSLRWIDITGKTLDIESSLHSGMNTISMEGFSRGLYFIQISSEEGSKMFKIIKH